MPKRRSVSDERGGGREARRRPMRRRRRQLYLVLDDWSLGCYSIHKLGDPASECGYTGLEPLPRPIYQLEAPSGMAACFTASLGGSKIMVAHSMRNEAQTFDARSRSLVSGPRPHGFPHRRPTFIPFGADRLCALWGGSLQLLHQEHDDSSSTGDDLTWSWRKLHDLPFDEACVTSYALHPNGQNIYVSVGDRERYASTHTTYCFDVDHHSTDCVLQATFPWGLPFDGRAYFVDELNAWVGLYRSDNTFDHLCACQDLNPDSKSLKISKESLVRDSQVESHAGATLVYMDMGGGARFCLVQCISVGHSHLCEGRPRPLDPPPFDFLRQFTDKPYRSLLRLTMFSVVVDENGDLTFGQKKNGDLTTGDTRRFRYYGMREPVSPVAFWM